MLEAIAEDLRTDQSAKEQRSKSHGNGPTSEIDNPAETHAVARHISGFTLDQMVSEYRALRASVLSLWLPQPREAGGTELDDVMRFNEAIDQALAESVASYSRSVTAAQNVFLGILGHDLRSPLGAILVSAEMLMQVPEADPKVSRIAPRIHASVIRAAGIVEDLLDFTRSQLGTGIPVHLEDTDVAAVCKNLVDETQSANPDRVLLLLQHGEVQGFVDSARVGQILSNLIGNAIRHGSRKTPIKITIARANDDAIIEVQNEEPPIAEDVLPLIFNFMSSHAHHAEGTIAARPGLGLGLYIVSEIVSAHKGQIRVRSNLNEGTVFTVELPLHE